MALSGAPKIDDGLVWPPLLPTPPPAPTVLRDDNLTARRENQLSLQSGYWSYILIKTCLCHCHRPTYLTVTLHTACYRDSQTGRLENGDGDGTII